MILVNISIRGKNTIQVDQEGLFELAILNFMFKRYNWSIPIYLLTTIQCLFLTLTIGIYMTKTLDRVNKLFSRNF
jgi:hypothetical protein